MYVIYIYNAIHVTVSVYLVSYTYIYMYPLISETLVQIQHEII